MSKRYSYKILQAEQKNEMSDQVEFHLKNGFKLHGSLQVLIVMGDTYPVKFFQVVVYESKEE